MAIDIQLQRKLASQQVTEHLRKRLMAGMPKCLSPANSARRALRMRMRNVQPGLEMAPDLRSGKGAPYHPGQSCRLMWRAQRT